MCLLCFDLLLINPVDFVVVITGVGTELLSVKVDLLGASVELIGSVMAGR